jgi:type II secretory ATPase GspE/PulE/Tfp pilus assembly ATPase PilB-like protein
LSTGYLGRIACGQIAVMNDALREAVLEHRPVGRLREIIGRNHPDLAADGKRLVEEGRTTPQEVRRLIGGSDCTELIPDP